jgi:hypothetical protein
MAKQTDNIVLEHLRAIRADMAGLRANQAETNLKIETLAGSMVSMRKDINSLESAVQGLRGDMRMIAIAVDGHAARLEKIEAHLAVPH